MSTTDAASPATVEAPVQRHPSRAARLWGTTWVWHILVMLLFGLPLFVGIGRTDYENDEAFHSVVVETMVKNGDWLTPRHEKDGEFLEKPPLKFWMVALPIRLGIVRPDEFGMRFCDAILSTFAFLYVFAIGRRLAGPVCGLGAVMILFAYQPLLFQHGLMANDMEASLLLAYSGGIYHFLAWQDETRPPRRSLHVFALALFFVLGFMVKFVAIAFLAMVLGVATLFSRSARAGLRRDWASWLGAGVLAAGLIAPWFLYQLHQFGTGFWHIIFGAQVFKRFTAYLDPAHLNPWYYYWLTIFSELWLSGAVAVTGAGLVLLLVHAVRDRSRHASLLLVWFALPLALMSLTTSKLHHYAYPYLAPLALAGGFAAAAAVRLAWSSTERWAIHLDATLDRWSPGPLRVPALRNALLAIAALAAAIAVGTHLAHGHLQLTVGQIVVLRNASAARAWVIAALMMALAARVGLGLRVAVVALVAVLLLPASGYARSLARLPVENHQLRSLGRCLRSVRAEAPPGQIAPGIWIEANGVAHFYYAYLRGIGQWQERDVGSDPTVFMHLYIPSMRTPVMLSHARYEAFLETTRTSEAGLLETVARKTGIDVASLKANQSASYVSVVHFSAEDLMLPGPYSICAAGRDGGDR